MGLNNINSKSTWGQAASDINTNFTTIDSDLKKVKNATTRNKGYFSSIDELKAAFSTANVGDIAYVGSAYPYAIWKWNGSAWANSGSTGGEESVNLGNYYTKVETDKKFTETDEKLSELGSEVALTSYTNNELANSLIQELYLYKKNGGIINGNYFISVITKNGTNPGSGDTNVYSFVVVDESKTAVCALYETKEVDNSSIVELKERNGSGIYGYGVFNFDNIEEGWHSGLNAMLKQKTFTKACNPYIYSYLRLNEESSKVKDSIALLSDEVKVESNFKEAEVVTTKGYYLANDGITLVEQSAFRTTEINVANASTVKVAGTHFKAGCTLCFKDKEGSIIGSVITVEETAYTTVEKEVPIGAYKAYTSYRAIELSDEPFIFEVKTEETLKEFAKSVCYKNYESFYDITNTVGLVNGSCNLSDGTETTNTAFGKSGKFDVRNYDSIRIYNRVVNTICYAKWFDAEGNEVLPRGNGDDSGERKYVVYDKPSGAVSVEISVIDWSRDDFIVEGGVNNNSQLTDSNGLLQQGIKNIPNVSMIPIFGQSLSIGAAATPVISKESKYNAAIMFATGIAASQKEESYFTEFVPLQERDRGKTNDSAGSGETVASGCVEQLLELLQKENGINTKSNFWNDHKFLFVTCGSGSKTISMLMQDYYEGLLNAVKGGKNIATSKGWTFDVPAVIYLQGETDQKNETTNLETYKQALKNFAETFNSDVKTITGQTKDVKVVLYQTCSQNIVSSVKYPTFNNTAMDIPTAQMELVREEVNFIACNPVYMLSHSDVEPIHLSAIGEKMMGLYCGIAIKGIITDEYKFKGLTLNTHTVNGNDIVLELNVPCPPLRIDTKFVKEAPNYGFAVIDSGDNNIISSVEVFDNKVTIKCVSSPIGCKLYYGFNGITGKDGRIDGARGNICDSADYIYNGEINGSRYALRNYLYSFCKSL